MCSLYRNLAAFVLGCGLAAVAGVTNAATPQLRVCADPDNLPYSHENGSGFENRIAELVASDLGAEITYTWLPQRRAFIRKTLNAKLCDVVIGVPKGFELVRTTAPYYRSTYVFVYRAAAGTQYRSFDEPALATARIGVQLIGDDLAATPPGHALAALGLVENVVGYTIYGERPQAERMIEALAKGELDAALIWGPQAAYYMRRAHVPLEVAHAQAPPELGMIPFEYSMAMGVRKADAGLQRTLDDVLSRRRADIEAILEEHGVPRVALPAGMAKPR